MAFPARRAVRSAPRSKVFNLAQGKAPLIALTMAVAPALIKVAGSLIVGLEKFYFALGEEMAHIVLPSRGK
jgi:hypothetical protein